MVMEMRWWLLALVALGCDAVGHKIHRASLGEAGDGLIDGSQGTFDNPLGSFDSNAETNSAAPAPVPAPQSSQSVALTSDEKACSELLVVTGGDAMTGKKHGFNQQKFTLETKGVFNKNDTNTYMARIHPKDNANITCGFRMNVPAGKLLKNPDSGTRTECLVAISPHYGPAGDSDVGGLGQTKQFEAARWPHNDGDGSWVTKLKDPTDLGSVSCGMAKIPPDVQGEGGTKKSKAAEFRVMSGLTIIYRVIKLTVCVGERCSVRKEVTECKVLSLKTSQCKQAELALVAMRG